MAKPTSKSTGKPKPKPSKTDAKKPAAKPAMKSAGKPARAGSAASSSGKSPSVRTAQSASKAAKSNHASPTKPAAKKLSTKAGSKSSAPTKASASKPSAKIADANKKGSSKHVVADKGDKGTDKGSDKALDKGSDKGGPDKAQSKGHDAGLVKGRGKGSAKDRTKDSPATPQLSAKAAAKAAREAAKNPNTLITASGKTIVHKPGAIILRPIASSTKPGADKSKSAKTDTNAQPLPSAGGKSVSGKSASGKLLPGKSAWDKSATGKSVTGKSSSSQSFFEQVPAIKPAPAPAPPTSEKPNKNRAGLSVAELSTFRELLLQKRHEILGDVSSMEREALAESKSDLSNLPVHMADQGTDAYEQEFTLGLVETNRSLLKDINAALAKIQDGTYGLCEGTQKPISKPRLEAIPWVKYSLEYAQQLEKKQLPFRR